MIMWALANLRGSSFRFTVGVMTQVSAFVISMLAWADVGRAEEPRVKASPKISIPDLVEPATRLEALQRFCLAADPDKAKEDRLDDRKAFEESHKDLTVLKLQPKG